MTKAQWVIAVFLLGTLFGSVVAKPAQAAGDELSGVVRALTRIADELGEIRRGGLKCHD